MNRHKEYFSKVLNRFSKMSELLIFDSLESLNLINTLTSTISSNIGTNPDGFNMHQNPKEFQKLQFYSRTFIRNFFAYVEGITYLMRCTVIEASTNQLIHIDKKIIAKMQEKEFDPVANIITEKNKFNPFKENLDLSFKQFSNIFGSDYKLNKGGTGWEIFNDLLKARNQITHPKNPEGYILHGKTITNMHKGALWFTESSRELINSCAAKLDNRS